MKRIHIVGCSPRSGTTLMLQLMNNCFEVDGASEHEYSIYSRPPQQYRLLCTKNPGDIRGVRPLLRIDPDLWVIFLLRDPRDVVVSRHGKDLDKYYTSLDRWRYYCRYAVKTENHPRFITVRYEDLVYQPEHVQRSLMERIPFLKKTADFSEFDKVTEQPRPNVDRALRGLRPIDTRSVGAWRANKPRLKNQIILHGPINEELIKFGYETDDQWLRELDGVEPDNSRSFRAERDTLWIRMVTALKRTIGTIRYATGMLPRKSIRHD